MTAPIIVPPNAPAAPSQPAAVEEAEGATAGEIKISIRNVNFYYDTLHALINNSIDIADRRITALIGPSGCGKSTFLRILNRMNDEIPGARLTGDVRIDGEDIYGPQCDKVTLRRRVGMVFQRPNPFPKSIFDNVAYGPRIHGETRKARLAEIVERSLRRAALWDEVKDFLHRSAFEISGGQQQRLCIARVLAVEPEVLLMDEPCSALDPASTFRIEELMRELEHEITIVIVTHNMQQAARVSDTTGFFLKGELLEVGPTHRIFSRPDDKRTEDYIQGRFG